MKSKRQDNKYIYNEDNQPNRIVNIVTFIRYRWLLVLLLIVAFISIIFIILRFTPLAQWKPTEFISVTTLLLTVFATLDRSFKNFTQRQYRVFPKLDILPLNNNHIKITASVQNAGTVEIEPDNISIFIDSGIYNDRTKRYDLPFLLKHESKNSKRKYDCILSEYCQTGKEFYPSDIVNNNATYEKFKNTFRTCYKLSYLSEESILYIGAGEEFSEDIIVNMDNPGVYRAILIVTAKDKACDCICISKQFMVSNNVSG